MANWASTCANQTAGRDSQNVGSLSVTACTTGGSGLATALGAWAIASTSCALRDITRRGHHFGDTDLKYTSQSLYNTKETAH